MSVSMESLNNEFLAKMGVTSLSELATLFPSAHTTEAYINEVDVTIDAGKPEDAFHLLSLSHSTLLHHRMTQKLYKPSMRNKDDDSGSISVAHNLLEAEKVTLATASKEDTLGLLRKLPSDWTVIQITAQRQGQNYFRKCDSPIQTPGLYISRCSCGPGAEVTLQAVASPQNKDVRGIIEELGLINKEKSLLYKEHKGKYEKQWTILEDLQDRIKGVVHSMGESWLRHWCCLMVGSLQPHHHHQLDQVAARVLAHHTAPLTRAQSTLLKLLMSCPVATDRGDGLLCGGVKVRAGVASVLGESVRSEAVKELCAAIKNEESTLAQLRHSQRNPIILILDKIVETLPWEMVWVLRDQPVTRMPSLRMLALLYQHHSSQSNSVLCRCVDVSQGFYVLDPENNLPRTQERLKLALSETGWQGITACKPTHDHFKDALSTKDVFVYSGHGSGSQYLPGEMVEGVVCRALVLLFGCRSVHLSPRGRLVDPWGVVLNYLVAYCPCVVGMLWDVTDKDTDLLTLDLLRALQGESGPPDSPLASPPTDVALLVARSRNLCRSTLTAAALAVYGLPLHLCTSSDTE